MKAMKIALVLGIAAICTVPAMAGPHHGRGAHHRGNDGVRLAANIIGLVNTALRAPAAVVTPPPVLVTPPPVIRHCPPPPRHHHYRPAPPPPRRHHGHHRVHGRR
ncbi:MAG: hypothetical protein IJV93_00160 [Lentisphaeria bacterium]|nr:hypothetical protein [Lentisphaeria bacterium]